MPPPRAKNIISCYNPACPLFNKPNEKAPLKCGRCKTAHYCDKTCQRAHWTVHKEFCEVWAETAKNNGQVPVGTIKKKMTQLIWLIRGLPDYTKVLLGDYLAHRGEGRRGCIEFYFKSFEELFEAIRVLEALPVIGEEIFFPMPAAPTYTERPTEEGAVPVGQKIPLRIIRPADEAAFTAAVDEKMSFLENDPQSRPNMVTCVDLVGDSKTMFLICVTVTLQGTYATHMYDFIYKRLSWYPEDTPTFKKKPKK